MLDHQTKDFIHLKGAREHNLKNLELKIPRNQLVVITGVSGSGKSSLAFDTIYAEGYRKYIDSLSTKARLILDQVKRPEIDFIHGLSPVIAIEQLTGGGSNPRSTVATVTEIADYARLLWAVRGHAFCPKDGGSIIKRSIDDCIDQIFCEPMGSRLMIAAPYIKAKVALVRDELPHLKLRGFQRVRINGELRQLEEDDVLKGIKGEVAVDIVVDRIILNSDQRSRIADSLELAFREGKDHAIILSQKEKGDEWKEFAVSQQHTCVKCNEVYEPVRVQNFSYSHPNGVCPICHGMGKTLQFNEKLIVPDPTKTVRKGAIKPLRLGSKRMIIKHNALLKQLSEQLPFDPNVPWNELSEEIRKIILHGAGDRLFSFKFTRAKKKAELTKFMGVMDVLEKIQLGTTSDGLRARFMTYQISSTCHICKGKRLSQKSLSVLINGKSFADFMSMALKDALTFVSALKEKNTEYDVVLDAINGLSQRLFFLNEVGLGYLSLDRSYSTLSGGEAQRARLATQLGMGLVGVAYVLDEPTIGLHAHDNKKLIKTLLELRDRGNAVIVVEHDDETIRAADRLIELGPGAGNEGGNLIFEGSPKAAESSNDSLTGAFLSGKKKVSKNSKTIGRPKNWLTIKGARENNLKNIDVSFPVGMLTCVSGVSGSGKSSLVNDILARAAAFKLNRAKVIPGLHSSIDGLKNFQQVVRINQDPIGRTPRSNPATYIKLFDLLRKLFAQAPLAKIRGYTASRFSFNVRGGRCEKCKGDGAIKLDMQFLNDVFVECPSCRGQRYNRETLEIRFKGYNIAEVLDLTVKEAEEIFNKQPRINSKLETLSAVGLGYIKLGQPANTLSGGEAQRIKLSLELSKRQQGENLYILDEPTTGLHWIDIQHLMDLLFKLRDAGNTIIVIEHNLDVLRLADWLVDLGPDGGDAGGGLLFSGSLKEFMENASDISYTAKFI